MKKFSIVLLWVLAPCLCWLSFYRPFAVSSGQAARLPVEIAGYVRTTEREITPRQFELLGTNDAVWREYRAPDGERVFLVVVFHRSNWKSVHPPHICLQGSNMDIEKDGFHGVEIEGEESLLGRIETLEHGEGGPWNFLSYYAFCAPGMLTGSYSDFVWHHAPRAILRSNDPGFLIRVESYVNEQSGGMAGAEKRCQAFLAAMIPAARKML